MPFNFYRFHHWRKASLIKVACPEIRFDRPALGCQMQWREAVTVPDVEIGPACEELGGLRGVVLQCRAMERFAACWIGH